MTESTSLPLAGRCALITGASSGLGAGFAAALAGAGAQVVCAARRVDRLAGVVDAIRGAGGQAVAVEMDVGDETSIVAGFDKAADIFGVPEIVIANAGISIAGSARDVSAADFARVMDVNVNGVFLTAREGARRQVASGVASNGAARIILIASIAGLRPIPGATSYSASKAAVVMMGKSLAREWARDGINVNTICPGFIETELNSDWLASPHGQKMIQGVPRRRVMAPDSLHGALLWLSGPGSAFVTGAVIEVDDGQGL